jgi:hypothetical protein
LLVSSHGLILKYGFESLEKQSGTQLNNVRHIASLPASVVISAKQVLDRQYIIQKIDQIKELFESGKNHEARMLIKELSDAGYDVHALKVLAMAERAQGLLLDELETILKLMNRNPQESEYTALAERLVEILETIHEPEKALEMLETLRMIHGDQVKYMSKIEDLISRCIPKEHTNVLLTGFKSLDMIRPEFRKAEIFGTEFRHAISWDEEKTSGNIRRQISPSDVINALNSDSSGLFDTAEAIDVVIKAGRMIAGPVILIRLKHQLKLPEQLEIWLEIRKGIEESKVVLHKVFVPQSTRELSDWNAEMLSFFDQCIKNPDVDDWFTRVEKNVRTLILSFETDTDEDDFFSIRSSKG